MVWQELLFDVAPLVISFVSAIVLFFRTGQKKYIARFMECMRQFTLESSTVVEPDVVISSGSESLSFKPSDYGTTADEVLSTFKTFLETLRNDK